MLTKIFQFILLFEFNKGLCSQCVSSSVYLSSDKLKCEPCQVNHCQTCGSVSNKCSTCQKNYQISLDKESCSCQNLQNCKACDNSDGLICIQCQPGYILDNATKTCKCNLTGCKSCKDYDGTKCKPSFCKTNYKFDFASEQCLCQIQNCSSCAANDGKVCSTCIQGYKTISPTNCQCNSLYCQTCDPQDGKKCSTCKAGYTLISETAACQSSLKNCEITNPIDITKCDQCKTYYKKTASGDCIPIIDNCMTIDAANKCTQCNNGYSLDTDQNKCNCQVNNCQICNSGDGKICDQCQPNYLKLFSNSKCLIPIDNCIEYNSDNTCLKCQKDYIQNLINNSCVCNVDNCIKCSSASGSVCDTCSQFSNLNNQKCLPLIKNCRIVDSNGICQQCNSGFKLENNTCICSAKNCNSCDPDNGAVCTVCFNNQLPVDGQCKCQDEKCDQCDQNDWSICQICSQGYFLYNDKCYKNCQEGYVFDLKQKQCVICSIKNCQKCKDFESQTCLTCLSGYFLYDDQCYINCEEGQVFDIEKKECEKCQIKNCLKCKDFESQICLTCQSGYNLYTDKCYIKCEEGQVFNLEQKQCEICSIKNCQKCKDFESQTCLTCQSGYFLYNDKCYIKCEEGQVFDKEKKECEKCQIKNCLKCKDFESQICLTCQSGYFLYNDKCYIKCEEGYVFDLGQKKCEKCQVKNCEKCKDFESQTCLTCSSGYILQENTNTCIEKISCDIAMCKQCSGNNICNECQSGFNLYNYQCQNIKEINFDVFQKLTDDGYKIQVVFDEQIVILNNTIEQIMDMVIDDFNSYKVQQYKITNNLKIEADLIVQQNCKKNYLRVTIKDDQFVTVNNLQSRKSKIQLDEYVKISKEEKQMAEQIKNASQSIQQSLLSSILPIAILGNFYVLFNTIDYTTFLYLLLFVNVRHPQNILNFCSIFQNFQMAFIPNLFNLYFIDPGYSQPYTPKKYMEQQVDAYFFNQGGQSLVIVFFVMAIYFGLKFMTQFDLPFQNYLQSKVESGWEYCGFIDLFGFVQVYIMLGVLLQFYKFEFIESFSFLNYTLFSICLVGVVLIPVMIGVFLGKDQDLTQPQIQKQYASILGGLRIAKPEDCKSYNSHQKRIYYQHRYIKYNYIILTLRKVFFCIFIIYMHDYPFFQLTCISTLNSLIAFYYLYLWPHEAGYENWRNAFSEFLLIGMQIAVGMLVSDVQDQPESDRFLLGWIFCGLAATLIFIHVITVFLDFFRLIIKILSFLVLLIKVQIITIKRLIFDKKIDENPIKSRFQKQFTDDKRNSPSQDILFNSRLKSQGINLDASLNSIKFKKKISQNFHKKPNIKSHKLNYVIDYKPFDERQGSTDYTQVKQQLRKQSSNSNQDAFKDDSSSNFYSSSVFSATARSNTVTKTKTVGIVCREELPPSKSSFFKILTPERGANLSGFEFPVSTNFKGSLVENQLSPRCDDTQFKSNANINPMNSYREEDIEYAKKNNKFSVQIIK